MGEAKRRSLTVDLAHFNPSANTAVLALVSDDIISLSAAKEIYPDVFDRIRVQNPPDREVVYKIVSAVIDERGLRQVSNTGEIDAKVDEVIAANADKVAEYKGGKQQLFGFFVGQVMKAMGGKANPKVVNERLRAKLD
jgi:aspartyl-tRNA(Asn)/glutamyl-tRNA(Gln) amidotransferase subunit B